MSPRVAELSDDEVRALYARAYGDRPDDLAAVPAAELRALLAAAEANLDELVELGFLTPAEAAVGSAA
jgi:hypothetical protein